jgi:hypothetical protein
MEMLSPSTHEQAVPLPLIEGSLTAIAVALSFAWPGLGRKWFSFVEAVFGRLARKKSLAVLLVGLSVIVVRIAILPWCPIPRPFVTDDFAFLLASDTFSTGHLTNPTPAMWVHFESIHIDMQPTYMSMYFPTHALAMAGGKVLFGNPWFGILIMSALMCAALCWALQAWLPPSWAFVGGVIAVLHLGLFTYWTNTFHAAGSIAALGGALVLGGMPRFKRKPLFRYALAMAVGIALMFTTRPFESLLLFIPVAVSLVRWFSLAKNRPSSAILFRRSAIPLLVVLGAAAWMGYYDYRVFGSPFTLPYSINRATYAMAPYFVWQAPRPEPAYRHEEMRRFYYVDEFDDYERTQSASGFLGTTLIKAAIGLLFFSGVALLPLLFALPRIFRDRRMRFLLICIVVLCAGMLVEIFLIPHYLAPFTVAIYALGLQAMRHIRQCRPGRQAVGIALTRFVVTILLVMTVLRVSAPALHLSLPKWPASRWNTSWYGPDAFGRERDSIQRTLQNLQGDQLAIVRYTATHNPLDEWVYNAPDIDHSKVIWAREMDPESNRELFEYYKNRKVWLIQPDQYPDTITPYPLPGKVTEARR